MRYTIENAKPGNEWRKKAIELVYTDGQLNWTAALGYKNYKDVSSDEILNYGGSNNTKLPDDFLEFYKVDKLQLHNVKMKTLRKEIGKFTDLVELDCSINHLTSLPKAIEKLHKLEKLDLSRNFFTTFPTEVIALKNLKVLDLRFNAENNHIHTILPFFKIPDEVKEALPNCEILI